MSTSRYTLIAYDTPNDRRRRQIVKILEGYGVRVQYSVFEAWLTSRQTDEMSRQLSYAIHPDEDSVLMLPASASSHSRLRRLGTCEAKKPTLYFVL